LNYHLNIDNQINKEPIIIKKTDENVTNDKYDILIKPERDVRTGRDNDSRDALKNKIENRPIREWDREKLSNEDNERSHISRRKFTSPSPKGRSQEGTDNKRRRHDSTKGGERSRVSDEKSTPTVGQQQEPESPAKLLDDLFKKTVATPSIYWLPLTEEQSITREVQRVENKKKREEEREAREEQMRKRHEDMEAERREFDATNRNERGPVWRQNSPNRRFNSPPNRRNIPPPRRGSPSRRFSPRRSPIRRSPSRQMPPFNRSPMMARRGGSPRRRR